MAKKLRVGIFSFSCCEGCQLEMFQMEGELFDLFREINLVNSRLIGKKGGEFPETDIAIVEGSIISAEEKKELLEIRKNAKFLMAIGACAVTGGVPGVRNNISPSIKKKIRGQMKKHHLENVHKVADVVKVDYSLKGCPINAPEFVYVMNQIVRGITPKDVDVPVCVECKHNENLCRFKKNLACLGPITFGGCNSVCINEGFMCNGCRGFRPDGNFKTTIERIRRTGMNENDLKILLDSFYSWGTRGKKDA
ncbi:MAG: cytochrome B [Candidatus Diapherotrites archaeon]